MKLIQRNVERNKRLERFLSFLNAENSDVG